MSSQMNSSTLARAAEQSAKAHAQAFVLRKTDGDNGMLIGGDAFAKVFASTQQETPKPRQADVKADDNTPDRTIHPSHGGGKKIKDASADRSDDSNDARDTEETQTAKQKAEARPAEKSGKKDDDKHACKSKDDKKQDDDAKVVADAAQEPAPKQEPTDTIDLSADAAAEIAIDQTPDTTDAAKAASAFLPAALKAQEAAGAEASAGDTDSKEQEAGPVKTGIADLLSFRANIVAGHKKAGKAAATDVTAEGEVKTDAKIDTKADAKADVKTEAKADTKPEAKLDVTAGIKVDDLAKIDIPASAVKANVKNIFHAELNATPDPKATQAPTANTPAPAPASSPPAIEAKADAEAQFTTAVHETAPKKDFNPAASDAVPKDAPQDTQVSQSPPAAGGRVNAQLGFSAPLPPTGPGSGSPPSSKAGMGVDVAANIAALNTSARIDGGAVIQLAKAMKTDGTVVSSPAEQVSISLSRTLKNGGSSFEVQLSPAELGKVEIKIDIAKDGTVNAVVTSDNPQTHDLLQKDAKQLEKVFQQAGLNTDGGSLNFQLRGEAQQQQQANQQQDNGHWKRWMQNTQNTEANVTAKTEFYAAAPGRVDVMI